jgi:glycosyltransferase involved in cell wall biosynthesis
MANDKRDVSAVNIELSIIVPTMNRRALLEEALNSIIPLAMTGLVEVIVADDGSSDGTGEFVRKHSLMDSRDGRIQLVLSATTDRRGAQVARNRGMSSARGKLVMFLDSDDVVVPAGVARLVERLRADSTLDYAYGKVIRTDEQLKPLPGNSSVGAPFSDAPVELAGYHWPIMGVVYRRNYLEKVGPWNEALTGSQDWEYQARVKLAGGRGEFVDTVVGYWRHHSGARVGTKIFRPDYVRSVMIACDSILQQARRVGRCDNALERRLAKKLIVHALEWGANGCISKRRECLSQAAGSLSDDKCLKIGIKCLQLGPAFIDSWLWRLLVRPRHDDRPHGQKRSYQKAQGKCVLSYRPVVSAANIELSIIVPTMNRRALLEETLNSIIPLVIAGPVEVIVADDGSSDGTGEFIRKHSLTDSRDGRIQLVLSATTDRRGAQVARNRGLSLARGKLVMFLDSDDVVVPGGVDKLVERLQADSTLDYAYGKVIRTDEQLKPFPGDSSVGKPFSDAPVEMAGYHWHTMGAVYRRNYLEKVGPWNEALTGSQDWEYQARVKLAGGRGEFVDTVVGYWRHHGGARVGTKAFRPDYVRSVVIACDLILQQAREVGRCDNALERRLAKKLIVHALEWGANGYRAERNNCFRRAAAYLSEDSIFRRAIWLLPITPTIVDALLWKSLVGK